MKKKLSLVAVLFGLLGIYGKSFSQTISQLSFFSPLISTFDMDYINDHLVISQQFLYTMDVSDPTDPTIAGQVLYPGNYAYHVKAEGTHVYMAMGNNGIFAVYNVSNFTMPWMTGSVSVPATSFLLAGDLAPFGNMVYMAGFDTLYTIDVSDSSAPAVIHTQEIADVGFSGAGGMGIIDSTLFITTPVALQIYDISDPATPVFITAYDNLHPGSNTIAVDTTGKRVFLPWVGTLATYAGHDAIDMSDPSAPVLLFSDSTAFGGGDYGEAAYYSNILFISKGGGVNAYDVSPFNHHYVTSFTGSNVANATVALDVRDSVFYNCRGGGFEVLLYSGEFPTSVSDVNEQSNSLQIFPNPIASNAREINIHVAEPVEAIIIRNALGREVLAIDHPSNTNGLLRIPVTDSFLPGIYFISAIGTVRTSTSVLIVE